MVLRRLAPSLLVLSLGLSACGSSRVGAPSSFWGKPGADGTYVVTYKASIDGVDPLDLNYTEADGSAVHASGAGTWTRSVSVKLPDVSTLTFTAADLLTVQGIEQSPTVTCEIDINGKQLAADSSIIEAVCETQAYPSGG